MTVYALDAGLPEISPTAYVADAATVIGRVTLADGASVWPGAVLRADNEPIAIGRFSNVQDGAVIHTDPGQKAVIGEHVSIGHGAVLHGCTVEEGCLIGINAVILNGAVIGAGSLVAAGALVLEGKIFPPRSLILGSPAKAVRELTDEQVAGLKANAVDYVDRAGFYQRSLKVFQRD